MIHFTRLIIVWGLLLAYIIWLEIQSDKCDNHLIKLQKKEIERLWEILQGLQAIEDDRN